MSYITGGNIQATDYNTFEALANGINQIFADANPSAVRNSISYPVLTNDPVTYGYGQAQVTAPVSVGDDVTAIDWANLFETFAKVGQHQNTTVVPPLPGSAPGFGSGSTTLPATGNTVIAYSGVSTLLNTLKTNRLLLSTDPTQRTFTAGTAHASVSPWTSTLTYFTQIKFGTAPTVGFWDSARHFFNSGGFLGINGSWPGASSPIELEFKNILTNMSPTTFNYDVTTPNTGTGGTGIGFYDLTTSYQPIFHKVPPSYSSIYVEVQAKLDAAAGTNGLVDFKIVLQDSSGSPASKTTPISFSLANTRTAGAVTVFNPTVMSFSFTYA